jgi:hypothetical protein
MAKKKKTRKPRIVRKGVRTTACVVAEHPGGKAVREHILGRLPNREREVAEYVEWQISKVKPHKVQHLERMSSETIFGRKHDVWDVHTTDGRWWVISEPLNLYPQDAFPSADYTLSFHIGLTARVSHRSHRSASTPQARRFGDAFRRWEQAAQALDEVREYEDLQAVGVKCRECLLAFVRDVQGEVELPPTTGRPKTADYPAWSEHIANWCLPGPEAEQVRHHLKHVSTSTWKLANWLTHTRSARHSDAELTVAAVRHLLDSLAAAIVRKESGQPDRCPQCSSYMLHSLWVPELPEDSPYRVTCEACGWENPASTSPPDRAP